MFTILRTTRNILNKHVQRFSEVFVVIVILALVGVITVVLF